MPVKKYFNKLGVESPEILIWKAIGGVEASQEVEENEPIATEEDEEEPIAWLHPLRGGIFSAQRTLRCVVSAIQNNLEH